MVYFAALTAGVYRSLRARNVTDVVARRLTADMTWRVYEKMAAVPWLIARLATAAHVVAFDVRRCPVAEYFHAQGLSQVCVDAWCNLDVPLAKKWGARLERTGTLAQGTNHCDFRWRVEERR